MINFTCPRRVESPIHEENKDTWEARNTCSYCGSLNPDILMQHLEAGDVKLVPTDKNYKVYVEGIPNPNAGKPTIYASANFKQEGKGWIEVTPLSRLKLPKLGAGSKMGIM